MSPAHIARRLFQGLCLLLAVWMVCYLFYAGSQPAAVDLIPPPWDKVAHFAIYSTVTLLLWYGTAGRVPLAVIAFVVAIGAFDEVHQGALPGRHADALDFLVDVVAVAATAGLMLLYGPRAKARGL